jgi:hypothetical protein
MNERKSGRPADRTGNDAGAPQKVDRVTIDRRTLLAGAVLAGAAAAPFGRAAASIGGIDLSDPLERSALRTRIIGSIAEEEVHTLYRMHIYAHLPGGNTQPLFTLLNYNIVRWQPAANGRYVGQSFESGVVTEFDTNKALASWRNPLTDETREVWHFLSGPIKVTLGPDGVETDENATLKPEPLEINSLGGFVFVPTQSSFSFPNPFRPEKWPKESAGERFFWDSFYTFMAREADLLDRDTPSVPAAVQFQNLVSWHPWLGMGQRDGRTFGRAYGAKLAGAAALPGEVRRALEAHTPEIFDLDGWGKPRNDFMDFAAAREPT